MGKRLMCVAMHVFSYVLGCHVFARVGDGSLVGPGGKTVQVENSYQNSIADKRHRKNAYEVHHNTGLHLKKKERRIQPLSPIKKN